MTLAVARSSGARYVLSAGVALGALVLASSARADDPAEVAGETLLAQATQLPAGQGVSASELQAAIDAIKRRVAEQQEGRETTGADELAAELRSARAAITELTQNLMRLRGERDALQAELETSRAGEATLRRDLAAGLERSAGLEAALAEAEARADRAETRASETARILAATTARADAEIQTLRAALAENRATAEASEAELRTLESELAAALDRLETAALDVESSRRVAADLDLELERERAALQAAEAALAATEAAGRETASALEAAVAARGELEAALEAARGETGQLAAALEATETQRAMVLEQLAGVERRQSEVEALRTAAAGRVVELEAELAAAASVTAALEAEIAGLREVASRSVAEVEALGETLLATLAENEALTGALAEARTTRGALEEELVAMRRDLESYAAGGAAPATDVTSAMPLALVASDAVVEAMDAELADLRRQIATLTEELIARDKQLAAGSAAGDVDALTQRLGLLQREIDTLSAENAAMASELATLQARAEIVAPELITASLAPDEALEHFLGRLNAVDTGDGWWMTVPDGLVFAPGSNELAPGTEGVVAQLAALIGHFGEAPVRIVGHTDSFGDAAVNKQLSLERAETVARLLVDRFGVDAARLTTEGFGEERPIASNATIEGRRANRRVEVYVQR